MNYEFDPRDELLSEISDTFKDAHGFRPRHIDFSNWSMEELQAFADQCQADAVETINREREMEQEALREYEHLLAEIQRDHNVSRHTAMRWLFDAENVDVGYGNDVDHFFWKRGVSFYDANRLLTEYKEAR